MFEDTGIQVESERSLSPDELMAVKGQMPQAMKGNIEEKPLTRLGTTLEFDPAKPPFRPGTETFLESFADPIEWGATSLGKRAAQAGGRALFKGAIPKAAEAPLQKAIPKAIPDEAESLVKAARALPAKPEQKALPPPAGLLKYPKGPATAGFQPIPGGLALKPVRGPMFPKEVEALLGKVKPEPAVVPRATVEGYIKELEKAALPLKPTPDPKAPFTGMGEAGALKLGAKLQPPEFPTWVTKIGAADISTQLHRTGIPSAMKLGDALLEFKNARIPLKEFRAIFKAELPKLQKISPAHYTVAKDTLKRVLYGSLGDSLGEGSRDLLRGARGVEFLNKLTFNATWPVIHGLGRLTVLAKLGVKDMLAAEKFGLTKEGEQLFLKYGAPHTYTELGEMYGQSVLGGVTGKVSKMMGIGKLERSNRKVAFLGGLRQATGERWQKIVAGVEAPTKNEVLYADKLIRDTRGAYGVEVDPGWLHDPVARMVTQFMGPAVKTLYGMWGGPKVAGIPKSALKFLLYGQIMSEASNIVGGPDLSRHFGVGVDFAGAYKDAVDILIGDAPDKAWVDVLKDHMIDPLKKGKWGSFTTVGRFTSGFPVASTIQHGKEMAQAAGEAVSGKPGALERLWKGAGREVVPLGRAQRAYTAYQSGGGVSGAIRQAVGAGGQADYTRQSIINTLKAAQPGKAIKLLNEWNTKHPSEPLYIDPEAYSDALSSGLQLKAEKETYKQSNP